MPLLGVQNPQQDYAVGRSLFDAQPGRVLLAGDWDRLAFLGEQYKVVLPFTSGSFTTLQASHADDRPLQDSSRVLQSQLPQIQIEMRDMRRFLAH